MHIAILEPYATGHRMDYVRYIVAELRDIPDLRVFLVTCRFTTDHPNLKSLLHEFDDVIEVEAIDLDYTSRRIFRALGRFAHEQAVIADAFGLALRRIAAGAPIDFVMLAGLET